MSTVVIVLNWNRWQETLACLESLRAHAPTYPVWVVDNGSAMDRSDEVLRDHPTARLLRWERNRGFAGGCNLALRLALREGIEYAFLLNNDCRVTAGSIDAAVRVARGDPAAAAVGSYVAYAGAPDWLQFDGMPREVGQRSLDAGLPTVPCRRLSGAAMLVKLAAIAECGDFDERLFCYWEDTEWCARVRMAGWRLYLAGGSLVLHGDRRSDVGHNALYYLHRNRYLVRRRLEHRTSLISELRFLAGGLRFAGRLRREGRIAGADAIAAGLWDGWMGKTGQRGPAPLPAALRLLTHPAIGSVPELRQRERTATSLPPTGGTPGQAGGSWSAPHPTITVLITTYNYARFVGRAIDSVLNQELPGGCLEILVVDDGSSDETPALVEGRYGSLVRYVRKERGGQASAINLGAQLATGDVICLLDADDYFLPGKLKRVAEAFARDGLLGLVYDEFDMADNRGRSLGRELPEPTWTGVRLPLARIPSQLPWLIRLGHPWTCITSAMSLRRSLLRQLVIPEDPFVHSPDLFLGLLAPFCAPVGVLQGPGTAYVYHGANVGLFRASAANRDLHACQMACIRSHLATRFGVECLTYFGRGIYGPQSGAGLGARGRLRQYGHESQAIVRASVQRVIKLHSQAKLAAALLLPGRVYDGAAAIYRRRHQLARLRFTDSPPPGAGTGPRTGPPAPSAHRGCPPR